MTAFVDSSALVKLYVPERQHEVVRGRNDSMIVASIARVEVAAALWRKHRLGELDAGDAQTLVAAAVADLDDDDRFVVVALTRDVIELAVTTVARHRLRAYDGVQLATALVVREVVRDLDVFVAFDVDLRTAASAEGFAVVPEELER